MSNVLTLPTSSNAGRTPTRAARLVARVSCTVNGAVNISFTRLGGSQKRDEKPKVSYESGLGCDVWPWIKLATDGGLIDRAVAAVWQEAGTSGKPIAVPAGILYRASQKDLDAIYAGTHKRCVLADPTAADAIRELVEACPTRKDDGVVRRAPEKPHYEALDVYTVHVSLCTWAV